MIGVVVGTVLVLINHGDHLAMEPVCRQFYLKVGLSYLTPFLVSLLSSWLSARDRRADDDRNHHSSASRESLDDAGRNETFHP